MDRRTPLIALGIVLLLLAGGVAAQASIDTTATSERGMRAWLSASDDGAETSPSFKISVEPHAQRGTPGATLTYAVVLQTRFDDAYEFSVVDAPTWARAHFPDAKMRIAAQEPARTKLVAHLTDAAEGRGDIVVRATSVTTGESQDARALVGVANAKTQHFGMHVDAETQRAEPGQDVVFTIFLRATSDLTIRLEAHAPEDYRLRLPEAVRLIPGQVSEAQLVVRVPHDAAKSEAVVTLKAHAKETGETQAMRLFIMTHERPTPEPQPSGWRMTLSADDLHVGAEGARVALLLQNDHTPRTLKLAAHDRSTGLRISLEQESLRLDAHERTWVWVHLANAPDHDAATTSYAIVASDGQTRAMASGVARSA